MKPDIPRFSGSHLFTTRNAILISVLLASLDLIKPAPVLADGMFVFKWNKDIDIREPTQKAIIVYDGGREDLLLQVKYEGPLEEFGWLIPVPALPEVRRGSMKPFYELSKLTQQRFGVRSEGLTLELGTGGAEAVKVIEIKTVGAYEVAVLSAQDSGSLERWLRLHDYAIPEGKMRIIDEYIHKGWYFIAAKIQLQGDVAFRFASTGSPKDTAAVARGRQQIQRKLASGELHPIWISFDTPRCVFPLKITAAGGKPSEVSVYVLSAEPLLERSMLQADAEKLMRRHEEFMKRYAGSDVSPARRRESREVSMRNMQTLNLAYQMYAEDNRRPREWRSRDWTTEDLQALACEGQPPAPELIAMDPELGYGTELLQNMPVASDRIPESTREFPRLKGKTWYLTKQVRTFTPEQMHDLEFEPAVPVLGTMLGQPLGLTAVQLLARFESNAVPVLASACRSADAKERMHAAAGLAVMRQPDLVEPLLPLLSDPNEQVRWYAVRAASGNYDKRFAEPLIQLLRDPFSEIRSEAAAILCAHEPPAMSVRYLELLRDRDPNVRIAAMGILSRIRPDALSPERMRSLVADPDPDVQASALNLLWTTRSDVVPRSELLPFLGSARADIVVVAWHVLRRGPSASSPPPLTDPLDAGSGSPLSPGPATPNANGRGISSDETQLLITNRVPMSRFVGLMTLRENGDARAVELALPLLRDTNSVVRSRAFFTLRKISGEDGLPNDPIKWERWWQTNRLTFKPRPLKQEGM